MKVNSFKDSKACRKASLMPPGLDHWPEKSKPFNYSKSEVVQWLTAQPEIQHYLFQKLVNAKAIAFDPSTGTWHGTARN